VGVVLHLILDVVTIVIFVANPDISLVIVQRKAMAVDHVAAAPLVEVAHVPMVVHVLIHHVEMAVIVAMDVTVVMDEMVTMVGIIEMIADVMTVTESELMTETAVMTTVRTAEQEKNVEKSAEQVLTRRTVMIVKIQAVMSADIRLPLESDRFLLDGEQ